MAVQTEVVYPSTAAFSGTGQLDLGPYFVPTVAKLLRVEVHGKVNFEAVTFGTTGVEANFQLWAVQWVAHGAAAANIVTTADGPNFPIRQQLGDQESRVAWAPSTAISAVMIGYPLVGEWAGQLPIGNDIDLYLSLRPPQAVSINNENVIASLRFWWA